MRYCISGILLFQVIQYGYIGFLSYFPVGDMMGCLNAVFCAPNKIFEYARFGVPMASNDILGIQNIFDTYQCGVCVHDFTSKSLAQSILEIESKYEEMSKSALGYYKSTDVKAVLEHILEEIGE